jgi:hypothetical protein
MKKSLLLLIALVAVIAVAGSAYSQVPDEPIPPPDATWAGTTDIFWKFADNNPNNVPIYPKRVGIVAYCADLYHNAGDVGLQPGQPAGSGRRFFDYLGQYGAQNIIDYLAYDDNIDRLRDAQIIDGDLVLPTAAQLIQNFDIVIAYTDNKCGQPIPTAIADSAAAALAGFMAPTTPAHDRKLILTGFAFSNSIGFGNAIFAQGLSPLKKGNPGGLAGCRRAAAGGPVCGIGSCAGLTGSDNLPCTAQQPCPGCPAECRDQTTNTETCGLPTYQPLPAVPDLACSEFLNNVNGPTSSSWATALTSADVDTAGNATLCFNYDSPDASVPFIAINAARNIIAFNTFPPDREDIVKFWYGCMFGNAIQYLSGDTNRCGGSLTCH